MPVFQKGPWTLERMAALKHQEWMVYVWVVIGIPLAALLLEAVFRRMMSPGDRKKDVPDDSETTEAHPFLSPRLRCFFLGVLLPLVLFVVYQREPREHFFRRSDEGLRLGAVSQAAHGRIPYRDIFFQYGPGIEILQPALAFRLYGRSAMALRLLDYWIEPLGAVALYLLAYQVIETEALLVFFIFILIGRYDLWITHRFALPALALIAVSQAETQGRKRMVSGWALAGALSAIGLFYSLESGVLLIPVLLAYSLLTGADAWRRGVRGRTVIEPCIQWMSGLAVVLLPVLFWLSVQHALYAFFQNTFLVGQTLLSGWGKPTPPVRAALKTLIFHPREIYSWQGWIARWWLPVGVYVATLLWTLHEQFFGTTPRARYRHFQLFALTGISFFAVALGRSDFGHWLNATPIFWVLLLSWLDFSVRKIRTGSWLSRGGALVVGVGLAEYLLLFSSFHLAGERFQTITGPPLHRLAVQADFPPLGPMPIDTATRDTFRSVTHILQEKTAPQDPVYVLGDEAQYYFFADRLNPTRYANLSYVIGTEMVQEVIRDLTDHSPRCILTMEPGPLWGCKPYQSALAVFLETHYRKDRAVGAYTFWMRRT